MCSIKVPQVENGSLEMFTMKARIVPIMLPDGKEKGTITSSGVLK